MEVSNKQKENAELNRQIKNANNILLLSPHQNEDEICTSLMTPVSPSQENILAITFSESPEDRLDMWAEHVGEEPANTTIITSEEQVGDENHVESVSDPGDLTDLGIAVTNQLSDWSDDGNQNVFCFYSLTAPLQYADTERVFRFIHVLTSWMKQEDVIAHYHMNPRAHDEQTVNQFKMLADAVVHINESGDASVQA